MPRRLRVSRVPARCTRDGSRRSRSKTTIICGRCCAMWSEIRCGQTWSRKRMPGDGRAFGIGFTATVVRGAPFGAASWQERTAKLLGLQSTLRARPTVQTTAGTRIKTPDPLFRLLSAQPGDGLVQCFTQIDRGLTERLTRGCCPEVQLVSGRATVEATVRIFLQVGGKGTAPLTMSPVDRAWPADLGAVPLGRDKPQQVEHRGDAHFRTQRSEINPWHGSSSGPERRNVSVERGMA